MELIVWLGVKEVHKGLWYGLQPESWEGYHSYTKGPLRQEVILPGESDESLGRLQPWKDKEDLGQQKWGTAVGRSFRQWAQPVLSRKMGAAMKRLADGLKDGRWEENGG